MPPLDCLLAVHISSGVLAWPWLILGGAAMVALLTWSTWEMHDEEIPRTALIAAVAANRSKRCLPPASATRSPSPCAAVMPGSNWRSVKLIDRM